MLATSAAAATTEALTLPFVWSRESVSKCNNETITRGETCLKIEGDLDKAMTMMRYLAMRCHHLTASGLGITLEPGPGSGVTRGGVDDGT